MDQRFTGFCVTEATGSTAGVVETAAETDLTAVTDMGVTGVSEAADEVTKQDLKDAGVSGYDAYPLDKMKNQ
ncbi:MAG: hypothetical protein HRU20_27505 [Pseudomonadales bacterium]|nr:hypothetical protein [Pseudomonadales bacterium]